MLLQAFTENLLKFSLTGLIVCDLLTRKWWTKKEIPLWWRISL